MLFNSIEFAIYLPIVFILYWFVINKKLKFQNLLLLLASYIFYGWWDWRFLSLIIFSSIVDFLVGIYLPKTQRESRRRLLLYTSVFINIGFLGVFKYFNFFAQSFADAFTFFGSPIDVGRLNIVLPVGISFYTFQTLSYSIDVYRRKLEPTRDIIAFFAFVSFFPQLVAGPIERAANLLPQFYQKRSFDHHKSVDGVRQILWGLFKKIVIADNCAVYVNDIFSNYTGYSGSTLLLGSILFSFQIYCDFSGYSDIAIGTARLFGFDLMRNFAFPYFSRDIAEFWRRWHISLSTWFRDYVYIPLGGSKGSAIRKVRNVFFVFIVSGLWHGANWTFVVWGFLNACYFLPLLLLHQNRNNTDIVAGERLFPNLKEIFQMAVTYGLTLIAWIMFRSESVAHALMYIKRMLSSSLLVIPEVQPKKLMVFIVIFMLVEWLQRNREHALQLDHVFVSKRIVRWTIYYAIIVISLSFGANQQDFIYFQF